MGHSQRLGTDRAGFRLIEPAALDRLTAHKRAAYLATPYLLDWLEPDHPSEQ